MIAVGDAIAAGGETSAFGRLGLFVRDAGGSLLALTSRELMHGGDFVSRVARDGRRRVGSRRGPFHPSLDHSGSAAELAAWFCPDVEVSDDLGISRDARVLDVDEQLGRHVAVVCADCDGPKGIVTRTRWFAEMSAAPGRAPSAYEGLIRIRVSEGAQAPGLSGALVRTLDDDLVGIVVGRYEADLIAVPLASILKSESLRVATAKDIRSHNRTVSRANATDRLRHRKGGVIAMVSAQLGFTGSGINLPEVVMLEWIRSGWLASTTNSNVAPFRPFETYFANLHNNLENLQSSILNFAVTELPAYPDHETATDALSIAMLEFFGSHGDWEQSVQRSRPGKPVPHGSHDYVRA